MKKRKLQKKVFLESEGNKWFQRNIAGSDPNRTSNDQIANLIKYIELHPKKVLEIGCSNGFRLSVIKKIFNAECFGIDPSNTAIEYGKKKFPNITLKIGTADNLPFDDSNFDIIIFGFCLYLCDRKDLFKIAYEADRCLQDEGTIIINDFYPPFPYKNPYTHRYDIYSFKMDYSRMFKWNPYYTEIANVVFSHSGFKNRDVPDEKICITALRKVEQYAYPKEPYK